MNINIWWQIPRKRMSRINVQEADETVIKTRYVFASEVHMGCSGTRGMCLDKLIHNVWELHLVKRRGL